MRAGRKIALVCIDPWLQKREGYSPFNFAARRVQAALLGWPLDGAEVHLLEAFGGQMGDLEARLEKLSPDLLGGSAYVWSFPLLLELARQCKQRRPDTTVILGGPSARPAMFAHPAFFARRFDVDALVLDEGEEVFRAIAALPERTPHALARLPGLALPTPDGWHLTDAAAPIADLDALPSVYEHGLMPAGMGPHLETFRGCPLSCAFCQWGDALGGSRVFSREYLTRDLRLFREQSTHPIVMVDAALNLNPPAFRNLAAAEAETGALAHLGASFEVYPSKLTDEHLRFLEQIKIDSIGVGLQSYDREVLRRMQRPFDEERFERVVRQLVATGAPVSLEIILGLPGDNPASFLRTLDRARALGCTVRVYHCLVLPNALMTRAPPWAEMVYEPDTLRMRSCAGWTERDLIETAARLDAMGGRATDPFGESVGTWVFSTSPPPPDEVHPTIRTLSDESLRVVDGAVRRATDGQWRVLSVEQRDELTLMQLASPAGPIALELNPSSDAPAFLQLGGVALNYRGELSSSAKLHLMAFGKRVHPLLRRLLSGGAATRSLPVLG